MLHSFVWAATIIAIAWEHQSMLSSLDCFRFSNVACMCECCWEERGRHKMLYKEGAHNWKELDRVHLSMSKNVQNVGGALTQLHIAERRLRIVDCAAVVCCRTSQYFGFTSAMEVLVTYLYLPLPITGFTCRFLNFSSFMKPRSFLSLKSLLKITQGHICKF